MKSSCIAPLRFYWTENLVLSQHMNALAATPLVGLAVASAQGGSIMMTSNCIVSASRRQSYVVTLAWMGMQCGGTWMGVRFELLTDMHPAVRRSQLL